jgi:hypothetical protein
MQTLNCDIEIPIAWSWVESVRQIVKDKLADYDEELRDSAVMVASELAENVVKHGDPIATKQSGLIQLQIEDGTLRIRSSNGVRDAQRVERLAKLVARLAEADDPLVLYLDRLHELLAQPGQMETQAGIYRIVCEGRFSLSQTFQEGVLTISAERQL